MIRAHVAACILIGHLGISRQPGQGFVPVYDGGAFIHIRLIIDPEIQKELELNPTQAAKANVTFEQASRDYREIVANLSKLPHNEERRQKSPGLIANMINRERGELTTFLSPEQLRRYDQIVLQQHSPWSLLDQEVAKKLKLSGDQLSKIRAIAEESMRRVRGATSAVLGKKMAQAEVKEKLQEIRQEANDQAVALLNEEQKGIWADMTGESS
jgi:hypothetical protein